MFVFLILVIKVPSVSEFEPHRESRPLKRTESHQDYLGYLNHYENEPWVTRGTSGMLHHLGSPSIAHVHPPLTSQHWFITQTWSLVRKTQVRGGEEEVQGPQVSGAKLLCGEKEGQVRNQMAKDSLAPRVPSVPDLRPKPEEACMRTRGSFPNTASVQGRPEQSPEKRVWNSVALWQASGHRQIILAPRP